MIAPSARRPKVVPTLERNSLQRQTAATGTPQTTSRYTRCGPARPPRSTQSSIAYIRTPRPPIPPPESIAMTSDTARHAAARTESRSAKSPAIRPKNPLTAAAGSRETSAPRTPDRSALPETSPPPSTAGPSSGPESPALGGARSSPRQRRQAEIAKIGPAITGGPRHGGKRNVQASELQNGCRCRIAIRK